MNNGHCISARSKIILKHIKLWTPDVNCERDTKHGINSLQIFPSNSYCDTVLKNVSLCADSRRFSYYQGSSIDVSRISKEYLSKQLSQLCLNLIRRDTRYTSFPKIFLLSTIVKKTKGLIKMDKDSSCPARFHRWRCIIHVIFAG